MQGILASLFHLFYGSRIKRFAGIPGPVPIFPFGTLLEFRGAKPWDVCAAYERKYGGVTVIWIGGRPAIVLNDPDLIREVLDTKWGDYYKDAPAEAFRPVLKKTEFNENGAEWKRLRMSEPLNVKGFDEWLPQQVPVVRQVADARLKSWQRMTESMDLLPIIERMVYDAYNACAIGQQLDDDAYRAFYITSNMATKRMKLPNWLLFPPLDPRFWIARSKHFGEFKRIVAQARQNLGSSANDLLHVYLRQGTDVSDDQLATFLGNIHAGGVFSTGTALVNTLYLLAQNPAIADKLSAQVRALVLENSDYDASALEQCALLNHILYESMRYFAPVPVFFRNVLKTKATKLGEHDLPRNTVIYIVVQGVHRSAKYWPDPDRFDPTRWEDEVAVAAARERGTFLPFGLGPRTCIGESLAMLCMKVILVSIFSKMRVEIDTRGPLQQFFHCGVAEPKGVIGRFVSQG